MGERPVSLHPGQTASAGDFYVSRSSGLGALSRCVVLTHISLTANERTTFHLLICHLSVLFSEMSVCDSCPFSSCVSF